jgi:hypothetical protein
VARLKTDDNGVPVYVGDEDARAPFAISACADCCVAMCV